MELPERRLHPGALTAPCLALMLVGCGAGDQQLPEGENTPSESLEIAAALPSGETDSDAGNPFEIPDPEALRPTETPSSQPETPVTPDGTSADVVYCD